MVGSGRLSSRQGWGCGLGFGSLVGLQDQFMRWALWSKVENSAFCCPFLVKLCGVGCVPTTFNPIMLLSTVGIGSPINMANTQLSWLRRTPLFLLVVATTALSFLLRVSTICLYPLATIFSNPLFISRLGALIKGMVRLAAIPTWVLCSRRSAKCVKWRYGNSRPGVPLKDYFELNCKITHLQNYSICKITHLQNCSSAKL